MRKLKPRRIVAYNRSSAVLERAREEAVIDEGFTDARKAVVGVDLVILTLYPQCIAPFLESCAGCLKEKALIIDAASVKGGLLEQVDALIPPGVDFVSGHPMAGREGGGYDSSDGDIFKGSNYILLPRPATCRST